MTSEQFDAVIVGAGFGGIGAAIQLKRMGYENFVILDREDDLGGTWHVNHYPGLAVDVPTTTYSYFFEPNPNWSRLFSTGAEIKQYADDVADKYDVRTTHAVQHHRRGRPLGRGGQGLARRAGRRRDADRALPDHRHRLSVPAEDARHPRHHRLRGQGHPHHGLGRQLHLEGQRVAIIGTGATAVQLIPELAKKAADLTVYQRTPIWVVPKLDFRFSRTRQAAVRPDPVDAAGHPLRSPTRSTSS